MPTKLRRLALPASFAALSDEELAVRAQGGGPPGVACYGELVRRLEGRLFNFLRRRGVAGGGGADAEDLTQEAFVRAWQQIGRYKPPPHGSRFSTWLFTIGFRMAVSRDRAHRRGRVRERGLDESGGAERAGASKASATDRLGDREQGGRLWALAAEVLSDDQHTALWLRYAEDLPMKEIARVLGKTQVGVRVSLFRARAALAEHAESFGWVGGAERMGEVSSDGAVVQTNARPRATCAGGV
jgi:RNA polymerase sigma-70 factor (ECF subfamily)